MRPISQTPVQLELFTEHLPARPYCSDDLQAGLRIRSKTSALRLPYIQHNPPCMMWWLVFDVDRPWAAVAWDDAGLPPPAWTAQNPKNGHAHIAWGLSAPVCTSANGHEKPLRYAAAVEAAYRAALGADLGYSGLITKNPLSDAWRVRFPEGSKLYTLAYLAEFVALTAPAKPERQTAGLGRNCSLFDDLRGWAYRAIRRGRYRDLNAWGFAVRAQAEAFNTFPQPLPTSEVWATAKSVARWTWRRFNPAGFSACQAARGRRKGAEKRQQGLAMLAAGQSPDSVALALEVDRATVWRWQQRQPQTEARAGRDRSTKAFG